MILLLTHIKQRNLLSDRHKQNEYCAKLTIKKEKKSRQSKCSKLDLKVNNLKTNS